MKVYAVKEGYIWDRYCDNGEDLDGRSVEHIFSSEEKARDYIMRKSPNVVIIPTSENKMFISRDDDYYEEDMTTKYDGYCYEILEVEVE